MASFTELLSSFEPNTKQYNAFLQGLLTVDNDIPFKAEEVNAVADTIISTINSRLNQANTRYSGLLLLDTYLPTCLKDTLLKYAMLWITKATQVLENIHSNPQHLTIACKVIGTLVIKCKTIPELQKQISMQNVKQLLNVLDNLESATNYGATYYLLATLLYHYPEVCQRFQVLIKKLVLLQVDASRSNLAKTGAKCFALLARATERIFKPPPTKLYYTCWTYNQAIICNSLHDIMDSLYSNLLETETVDIWDKLELPSIPEENVIEYYSRQKQRFSNLCYYLTAMLRGCEEKNSVLPDDVLRMICRGLAIRPINLKRQNSFKEQILYLMLPKLHISLFNVLCALIDGFKQELVPFGSTILLILNQTLQWTGTSLDDQVTISSSKPFKNIRLSVYKCLSLWLACNNSLSGVETIVEECLPSVLRDIIPEKDRVLLTVQSTQSLSKKALKRFRDGQYEKSSALNNTVAITKNLCIDADLCKEALIILQNILSCSSIYLKQTFYKNMQNVVIPLLYEYYLGSSEKNFYKEITQCRLQLLRVLKNLQLNPHATFAPSTQYAVKIFEMALYDTDLRIVQEARCALTELEKIIHPAAPTLCLPKTEEISNGYNEVSLTEVDEREYTKQKDMLQEEFLAPLNKRPKIIDVVTLNSNKKVHFDLKVKVIDEVTEKLIDINSPISDETTLQENKKNILNKEEMINVENREPELHDSQEESQKLHKIDNKQVDKMETTSTELSADDRLKENQQNNLSQQGNNQEVSKKKEYAVMDDDEEELLLLFRDEPRDSD